MLGLNEQEVEKRKKEGKINTDNPKYIIVDFNNTNK